MATPLWTRATIRELIYFLVIGGIQYVVDVSVFGLLTWALGLPAAVANLISRATGAVCGYYLNGVFTFRALGRRRGESYGLRFVLAWSAMTIASTVLVEGITLTAGRGRPMLLVAGKAAVELVLFVVSFLLCKLWVFVPRATSPPPAAANSASATAMGTLFIFAHADDEFFFAPRIRQAVAAGRSVYCIYTTDGAAHGASSERRQRESVRALRRLGVPEENLLFVGGAQGIADGSSHRQIARLYAAVESAAARLPIDEIYVTAWEGGHADHDTSHLVGVALARRRGIARVYECPGYHAHAQWLPFRVMSPLPPLEDEAVLRLTLAEGLASLALCECHPSQWKTWLGLLPEAFVRFVVQRRHVRCAVGPRAYRTRPHPGRLLYETRFGVPFEEFLAGTAAFIAERIETLAQARRPAAEVGPLAPRPVEPAPRGPRAPAATEVNAHG